MVNECVSFEEYFEAYFVNYFLKNGPLFHTSLVFFKQKMQSLQQSNVKNVHPV